MGYYNNKICLFLLLFLLLCSPIFASTYYADTTTGSYRTVAALSTLTGSMLPGDTVEISCGQTWDNELFDVLGSGTSNAYINIKTKGNCGTNRPIFPNGIRFNQVSYVKLNGLKAYPKVGYYNPIDIVGSHDIYVSNCYLDSQFSTPYNSPIRISGSSDGLTWSYNIYIDRNFVTGGGTLATGGGGLILTHSVHDAWITNNWIWDNYEVNFQTGPTNTYHTNYNYNIHFKNNYIWNSSAVSSMGVNLALANNSEVANNYAFGNLTIAYSMDTDTHDSKLINNFAINTLGSTVCEVFSTGQTPTFAGFNYNNIVANNVFMPSSAAAYGIWLRTQGSGLVGPNDNIKVVNNVIQSSYQFFNFIYVDNTAVNWTNLTINNNDFYDPSYSTRQFKYLPYGSSAITYSNIADWRSARGFDLNSITTDPLLNSNYTLKSNSPLIGTGVNVVGINTDAVGTARPYLGKTSIGAYEYSGLNIK